MLRESRFGTASADCVLDEGSVKPNSVRDAAGIELVKLEIESPVENPVEIAGLAILMQDNFASWDQGPNVPDAGPIGSSEPAIAIQSDIV